MTTQPATDSPQDKTFEMLGCPGDWPYAHWFRCPNCGELGVIDREQYFGYVSIICDRCNWHGHRNPETGGSKLG